MTMSITDHIKILQATICYLCQLLNGSFAVLATGPLKETHTVYSMDDLVKIPLAYV
jgi:hypothetical protein